MLLEQLLTSAEEHVYINPHRNIFPQSLGKLQSSILFDTVTEIYAWILIWGQDLISFGSKIIKIIYQTSNDFGKSCIYIFS